MKLKLKIAHKILMVGLIPLLACLGAVGVTLNQQLDEHAVFSEMGGNIGMFQASTALIGHLQRERGRTALFLSGGSTLEEVRALRDATDRSVPGFLGALPAAALPADKKAACRDVGDRLKAMRAQFNQPDLTLRDRQIADYTGLIQDLLGLESAVANARTTRGFGKVLNSLMILEVAKESAGRLRANASSLLAANAALSSEQFSLVLKLKSEVDANLSSPALVLSKESKEKLASYPKGPAWTETEQILKTLLIKAGEGAYEVAGDRFFTVMTQKIDDLAALIDAETTYLSGRLNTEQTSFQRTFYVTIGAILLLTVITVFLTLAVTRNIVRRLNRAVSSLKDIAEGEGNLALRLPPGDDELGALATYFNRFASRLQTMMLDIRGTSAQLSGASTEMSSLSRRVAGGAQDTSAKAATVATAAEEMSANTASVAAGMEQATTNLSSAPRR